MKKLIINGSRAGGKQRTALITALNSKKIRTEKGGYLFKAAGNEQGLHLGVIPCIIEGERTHHYDIELPKKFSEVLIGHINPEGVFSILFIPKQQPLGSDELAGYRRIYIDFARTMIELGLESDGALDKVSVMMLTSSGVIPEAPEALSLAGLAGYDKSTPKNS